MPTLVFFLAAFTVGALAAVQPVINAQLRNNLESPFQASVVSFLAGVTVMSAIALGTGHGLPSPSRVVSLPWWMWLMGGTLGAIFVTTALLVVPRIGPAMFFGCLVAGQMLASILLEQWGVLGLTQDSVNPGKVIGATLVVAGVFLIGRS
jgi:transporter family-2 protein